MDAVDPYEGLRDFPTPQSGPQSLEDSALGRDAFLKIFLTQLANQDPEAPQDASELGAQLATFSQVEQQTLMAEQLRGVNTRLDTLIESLAKPSGAAALDPVSLIGKNVEVASSSLTTDFAVNPSSKDTLRFEITQDNATTLLIEGETGDGNPLGLAALSLPTGQKGFAKGWYELSIVEGRLALKRPDGTFFPSDELNFQPFVHDEESGQPLVVPPDHPDAEKLQKVSPGIAHTLLVATRNRDNEYRPLSTQVSGTVDAVRVVEGKQVLTVKGVDLDPAKIIRVR